MKSQIKMAAKNSEQGKAYSLFFDRSIEGVEIQFQL